MAKPKAVPEASSRESPQFWFKMIDASGKRRQRVNEQSARYMRWHRGNLSDVVSPSNAGTPLRWQTGLENHTNSATVSSLADLFFRCPRFNVQSPYLPKKKPLFMPGMPPPPELPFDGLFSPELARVETEKLRQTLDRTNYFEKKTRVIQDALLADMGVLKITHDAEVSLNEDDLAAAVAEADEEIRQFLSGNVKAMWAEEEQIHSVHIERKSQLLAAAERKETILDSKGIKYLRAHLRVHEAMKGSDRVTETVRANSIRIQRINPITDYFYDPTVDDRSEASWRGSCFLVRKAELYSSDKYDKDAVQEVRNCQDRWETREHTPEVESSGSYDIPEEMAKVFEVFDLVAQKRILFADGSSIPLIYEDRGALATLQPSGPFSELVFMNDGMEGQGIPPPAAYEAEQAAATHIATSNVAAAIQSQPRTVFNMTIMDPVEAKRVQDAKAGEMVGIKLNAPAGTKLDAALWQAEATEIPEQNLFVLQRCSQGIERRSGLGTSKMGGGEQASTATGAALGADASSSISEDRGAKIDRSCEYDARQILRLERYVTPYTKWVQEVGPEAIAALPPPNAAGQLSIAIADACNDVGVRVITGSARRHNTNVDQKQVTELAVAAAGMPMMQGPAGQKCVLAMLRQIADDAGVGGLPWDDVEQEIDMQAALAQMMGQPPGQGAPGAAGPPGASGSREGENAGVAQNDMEQGVQNVGAGRVPTGASIGDRIIGNREGAKRREVARVG